MKLRDWINILKESLPWTLLLCICNAFYIFLAWLAYPEAFRILAGIMVIFSVGSIVIGILLTGRGS